ncbi:YceI family protein [Chryseotalea sanaruensis]|uniref:YceI family protein n=1 Tax=Chryseotalea sanaruensis TaxID=2482724 RepID=A0A401U5P3_9BACT|nr:YceI family protein [Chryseotalea sanaruensis]GCC50189.1 YceI family protein [Chryseotalea sanaruensis]
MNKGLLIFCLLLTGTAEAQKYNSTKGSISFLSDALIEDIAAENTAALAILDASSRQLAFSVPVNEFQFEKKLMQAHFNEKYLETEKYPKATFQGSLSDFSMTSKASQQVTAKGKLTIHGVTKDVQIPGTLLIDAKSEIKINAAFVVALKDYNVKIPKLLWENIAEEVNVKIDFTLQPK